MPSILIVCTANVCRSPLAEISMRRILAAAGGSAFTVSSAGSAAADGLAMCATAREQLGSRLEEGVEAEAHLSRRLTREVLDAADLVLVPDFANRARVVSLQPIVRRRTFTLREFVQVLPDSGSFRAPPATPSIEGSENDQVFADWVDALYSARPHAKAPGRASFLTRARAIRGVEIADGHNLGKRLHRETAEAVGGATRAIAEVLLSAVPNHLLLTDRRERRREPPAPS